MPESGAEYEQWLDAVRLSKEERRRPKKLSAGMVDELRRLTQAAASGELDAAGLQEAMERLKEEGFKGRQELSNEEVRALRQRAADAVRHGLDTRHVVDEAVRTFGLAQSTVYQILRHDHYAEAGGPYIAGKGNNRIVLDSAPG